MFGTPVPKSRVSLGGSEGGVRFRRGTGGRVLSLRHSPAAVYRLRSVYPLVSSTAKTGWVHAAKADSFNGHPSGPFELTRETFAQMVRNFDALENQAVPLTYDHPDYDGTGPVELAGYVHKLEVRGSDLWAFCEFTDKAVALGREGSYKWASIVAVFDSVDRKSGEEIGAELLELALTSSPFIDGLSATDWDAIAA